MYGESWQPSKEQTPLRTLRDFVAADLLDRHNPHLLHICENSCDFPVNHPLEHRLLFHNNTRRLDVVSRLTLSLRTRAALVRRLPYFLRLRFDMAELLDSAISNAPLGQQTDPIVVHAAPTFDPVTHVVANSEPLLLCRKVSKWYGPVIGVNQVTLELRSGITALVGSNGAGKSTLMRLITGHVRPDIGAITVQGVDAWSARAKRLIGYCPDVDAFYEEMSGREFIRAMAHLCGYDGPEVLRRTEAILQRVGMADRADRRIRGYSKGMRQRIKLAQALIDDPPLLVLDEPLSGIDPVGRAESVALFAELARQGKCLLISSHELDELEKLTDHVAIMSRGRIAAVDTVGKIRRRLADHPLTVRIDIRQHEGERGARELAGRLIATMPEVVGVEMTELEPGVGQLRVRARNAEGFFVKLNKLIVEDRYDIAHLETLDGSTQAVLGYLLGRSHG
jgi:ABC-2 type transport system ATP-binding protein